MAKIIGRVVTTPPPKKLSKYENDKKYVTETKLEEVLKDIKADIDLSDIPTEVVVQDAQPSEGTLWINTGEADEIILAEIDDNTTSDEKTWSSTKIESLLNGGNVDLTNYYTKEEIDNKLGGEVDILPKADYPFEEHAYAQEKLFGLVAGKTYTVEFDEEVYVCECSIISMEGQTVVYIGNDTEFGGTNNDIPFVVLDSPSDNIGGIMAMSEDTSHNIRIYTQSTFVTKSEVVAIVDEIINEALDSEV